MTSTSDAILCPVPTPGRRQRGGVVTWAVIGLMLAAMLVYLVVAFVSDDGGKSTDPSASAPIAEGSR